MNNNYELLEDLLTRVDIDDDDEEDDEEEDDDDFYGDADYEEDDF